MKDTKNRSEKDVKFKICGELSCYYKLHLTSLYAFCLANQAIPVHDLKTIAQLENFISSKKISNTYGQA